MIQHRINANTLLKAEQDGRPVEIAATTLMSPEPTGGSSIKFDQLRTYGYASPLTGNLSIDLNGGVTEGITQLVIHNAGTEPTYGTNAVVTSGAYVINVDNYIFYHAVKPTLFLVTITQAI